MTIKNKTILITGGAGFIGGHLFETLVKENNFVYIIDNFNDYYEGKEENFKEISNELTEEQDYKLIRGNLVDEDVFNAIDKDIDVIFHLAAQAGVRYSLKHAAAVSHNNITSMVNVLEYASEKDIKKVIYASSSSIYGNPVYTPVDEGHPKNPISPYAVSKLACEIYCDLYYREYGIGTTSCRFYTVYGPRGRPDMAIRKFFNLMLNDQQITIYGDGSQLRDFTFVSDIVNGLILAAESKEAEGEAFNLGVSDPISVNDLVNKMYSIAEKEKNLNFIEKQKGDVDVTYSDTKKANKLIKYYPKVTIDEGLRRTFDWMVTLSKK